MAQSRVARTRTAGRVFSPLVGPATARRSRGLTRGSPLSPLVTECGTPEALRAGLLRISQVSSIDRSGRPPASDLEGVEVTDSKGRAPSPGPTTTRPHPSGRRGLRWAALFVVVGFVIVVASLVSGWWALTVTTSGGPTVTTIFAPGSQYQVSCSVSGCGSLRSGSLSYTSGSLGAVGNLYEAVQVLLILSAVLSGLAVAVVLAGVFGRSIPPRRLLGIALATFLAFLLALVPVVAVAGFQTSALDQDGGGIPSAAPSPLSSFWGSCSASGGSDGICFSGSTGTTVSANWGPSTGWALAIVGALILLLGFVALLRTRPVYERTPAWGASDRV